MIFEYPKKKRKKRQDGHRPGLSFSTRVTLRSDLESK